MAWTKNDNLFMQASSPIYDGNHPSGARPAGGGDSSLGLTTSITQRGVTITFADNVEYGQYVNGDHWIKDAGNGISVTSKTPAQSTDANGYVIHGSMINPSAGGQQGLHQSQFTSNTPNTNTAAYWNASETVSFPLSLSAGDALLAGISREDGQGTNWRGASAGSHPVMKAIEVFTVIDHVPNSTEFRPSPVDRLQTRYDSANINYGLLPSLSTASVTLPNYTNYDGYNVADNEFKYFERGTERYWPVWIHDYQARQFHPMDHMEDYHRELGMFLSEALVLMCTDASQAEKEQLVKNFCQIGIDYYGVGKQQSTGDSSWWRSPMVITGYLLGDTAMRDCYLTGGVTKRSREEAKFYYDADRLDTGRVNNGTVPNGETWAGHHVFFRKEYSTIGEYETRYPSEWSSNDYTDEGYRRDTDVKQMLGQAFVLNLLGLQTATDYKPLFEMFLRWTEDADITAEYNTMIASHSAGSQPILANYTNGLGTTFMTDMYTNHKTGTTWPDVGGTTTRTL